MVRAGPFWAAVRASGAGDQRPTSMGRATAATDRDGIPSSPQSSGRFGMDEHPPASDACDDYDTGALIRDIREITRRQTRTLMLTLLAMTLLNMTSTVVSHVWL